VPRGSFLLAGASPGSAQPLLVDLMCQLLAHVGSDRSMVKRSADRVCSCS
jgi:hypothetical protein